ncbi:MAG: hypothetical protein ACK6DX_10325 [Acidobacteriota bacterium]
MARRFSRPFAAAPRPCRLTAISAFPLPTSAPSLPRQCYDWGARTSGKYTPSTHQLPHPRGFVRLAALGPSRNFRFDHPATPTSTIANLRHSGAALKQAAPAGARPAGILVQAAAGTRSPIEQPWLRPQNPNLLHPRLTLSPLPARTGHTVLAALSPLSAPVYRLSWEVIRNKWREAPNDLRWVALAVPLIIGLLWFSGSPSAQNSARETIHKISRPGMDDESLQIVKTKIQRRAAIELHEDFRQGLSDWSGDGDWSKAWRYDQAGFLHPGQLALYTPSIHLEDYRFEFLGVIEQKALSWVFRAADLNNYYTARLEIRRGGSLPVVELVRWAVINGKPGPRSSIPIPWQPRMDTVYRIGVETRGNNFVTTLQGQVVDVFTDDRLPRGGVGFYSGPGEDARLRWMEISHQCDMLGRLCAYLAPNNQSNPNARTAP